MERPWFKDTNFRSLEIRKAKSLADHAVVKSVVVSDVGYISRLAGRISKIPADGDMMISFSGAAEQITLAFFSILIRSSLFMGGIAGVLKFLRGSFRRSLSLWMW